MIRNLIKIIDSLNNYNCPWIGFGNDEETSIEMQWRKNEKAITIFLEDNRIYYLKSWVDINKYIIFETSKEKIKLYTNKVYTLKDLFNSNMNNYVLIYNEMNDTYEEVLNENIPEIYLPEKDSYYDEELNSLHD